MAEIQLAKMTDIEGKVDRTYVDAQLATKVNDSQVLTNVPANAKFTDTVYTHPANHPVSMITGLSTVATSGSYNDLSNKPSIPTVPTNVSAFTNDVGYITGLFDNTTSGLTATTIQEAINELKALIDGLNG